MEKGIFIEDIRPGDMISGLFCVASKSTRQTRSGAPYLSLTLVDSSGYMDARVWDRAEELGLIFEKGDIIHLEAEAVEFNGRCQLKVNDLEAIGRDTRLDPAMFLPSSPADPEACWKSCEKAMASLKNPVLQKVLRVLFSDPHIRRSFIQAPAAKKMHHACIGGLVEHCANLVRLSKALCRLYPHLDKDLLIAACLCHDLGKIREYSWHRPPIDYTDQGRLLGHIAIGLEMLDAAVNQAGIDHDSMDIVNLKHMVLSHHGSREFGSPVLPMTEEALVFHMLDDLDAKLNFLLGLKEEGTGSTQIWTEFQRLFDRYFFLRPRDGSRSSNGDSSSQAREETRHPAQARLWDP